ncbi:nucleotide disphospho-sugar-binding domain-containing protein [Streptomyces sp. NPDC014894]|uniref:nucleotide disphospho-sugar-binding domain-containing protein n=1 Tax=Streptomyces sp. NPDC014894 TaxID=3364931 RepID=UPI003701A294
MRVLIVPGPSPATVFGLAPLANALRLAGHSVLLATTSELAPTVTGIGLPAVAVTDRSWQSLIVTDRAGAPVERMPRGTDPERLHHGGWFGRLAAASLPGLRETAAAWRPSLVVGGSMSYAAGLLAAELGVPCVRQSWDPYDTTGVDAYAAEELRPELDALGLPALPGPALAVDVCPPSLRPPAAPAALAMRWVPGNAQRPLEPWMFARGDRPRVCVTSGSRETEANQGFLLRLVEDLTTLDAEIVIAAPEEAAGRLRERFGEVRVGWMPLDVVAPTCDLVIHHGGGVTGLTALVAGAPQLLLPRWDIFAESMGRMSESGAARVLYPEDVADDTLLKACGELLHDPAYGERARAVAAEIASLPAPAETARALESLASG